MRTLRKNKRKIYYALKTAISAVSSTDTITVDGQTVYVDEGDYGLSYDTPVKFLGNISFSGGDSTDVEFGLDMSAYDLSLLRVKMQSR